MFLSLMLYLDLAALLVIFTYSVLGLAPNLLDRNERTPNL